MAGRILAECTPLAQHKGIGAMTTSMSTLQEQSQKNNAAFVPNYIRTQHRFLASNEERAKLWQSQFRFLGPAYRKVKSVR
jgi:hypothetical protein